MWQGHANGHGDKGTGKGPPMATGAKSRTTRAGSTDPRTDMESTNLATSLKATRHTPLAWVATKKVQCHVSATFAPCHFHVSAMSQCHVNAMPMPGRCHVRGVSMLRQCQCHFNATSVPCHCHVSAMSVPCHCHVNAIKAVLRHVQALPHITRHLPR